MEGILNDLIGFWQLEEASGTRFDSGPNALDLEPYGAFDLPSNAPGIVGDALYIPETATTGRVRGFNNLFTPPADFTVVCWVNFSDISLIRNAFSKMDGSNLSYAVDYEGGGTNRFRAIMCGSSGFGDLLIVLANTFGAISINTWYMITYRFTATSNLLEISINAGPFDSGVAPAGMFVDNTMPFNIGANDFSSPQGMIDQVGLWARLLTQEEIEYLYNEGNGRSYEELEEVPVPATPDNTGGLLHIDLEETILETTESELEGAIYSLPGTRKIQITWQVVSEGLSTVELYGSLDQENFVLLATIPNSVNDLRVETHNCSSIRAILTDNPTGGLVTVRVKTNRQRL